MKLKDIHYELNEAGTLQYDQNVCNLYLHEQRYLYVSIYIQVQVLIVITYVSQSDVNVNQTVQLKNVQRFLKYQSCLDDWKK